MSRSPAALEDALLQAMQCPDLADARRAIDSAPLSSSEQELARRVMDHHFRRLAEVEHLDALTGLPGREAVEREGSALLALARRHAVPATLMIADLRALKHTNDTKGLPAGDARLRAFARDLRQALRDSDRVGRWGGDEFVLLLPHTDTEGAQALVIRLRQALGTGWHIGWATSKACEDYPAWFAAADRALRQAKHDDGPGR